MSHSKLDRDGIVEEALALLAEQGLADVSLRKLAARLKVTVSSLYWHIRDRDELLALMCVTVFRGCLEATPDAAAWDGWLHNFAQALWDRQVALRDCQKLIIVSRLSEAQRQELLDEVAARMARHGICGDQATVMQTSIQALVTGWSTLDQGAATWREFELALAALLDGWRGRVRA